MKTVIVILLLFSAKAVCGQNNAIDKFFKEFQSRNSLDAITLSGKMLPILIEDKKGNEREEVAAIIKKLTGLKVISKNGPSNGDELFATANSLLSSQYELILTLDEKDRKVKCYTLESAGNKVSELLMIAFQWGRFMVLSITGDIDLKEIYKLTQNFNFGQLQNQKDQ